MNMRNEDVRDALGIDARFRESGRQLASRWTEVRGGARVEQQDAIRRLYQQRLKTELQFVDRQAGGTEKRVYFLGRVTNTKDLVVIRKFQVAVAQRNRGKLADLEG